MALRVVVVGLGQRGLDWARVVRQCDAAVLVGAADLDAGVRQRVAAEPSLAGVPLCATLDDLLPATPEAVVVATAAQHHAAVAARAIEARLAVLVEKPFALDLEAAVRTVRLAEDRGVPLLVGQNYRYMRAFRTVRRVIAAGGIGALAEVTCHYWRPSHVVNAGLAAIDAAALWETGVHHLDALRYCTGRRVVGVAADVSSAPWTRALRGTSARLLLEFEDGVRGTYTVSWDSRGHESVESGQQFYARFGGEGGTLHVLQRWLVLCRTGRWPRVVSRGRRAEPEEAVLLRQLAGAREGVEAECSGRDNLQTMAVLAACEEAARRRCWVNPQELLRARGA